MKPEVKEEEEEEGFAIWKMKEWKSTALLEPRSICRLDSAADLMMMERLFSTRDTTVKNENISKIYNAPPNVNKFSTNETSFNEAKLSLGFGKVEDDEQPRNIWIG